MLSVYIHIPFCNYICSYCDFCKVYYKKEWVDTYLESLRKEIESTYKGEPIRTLYIGGGTPTSLNIEQLQILFDIIKIFNLSFLEELTIESNVESLTHDKLILFKNNKVNRLSIGIQTFNPKHLSFLNRHHTKEDILRVIKDAKEVGLTNINIDLIYGIPNQTLSDLKEDINEFLKLDIPHISLYSLIIEEHTKIYIDKVKEIDEDLNYEMYKHINDTLDNNLYHHYEISNYAKYGYESKHNLVYWNNEHYYGFGLGASSYIDNKRYDNTRSFSDYIKGKYIYQEHTLKRREMMENEMILGLRKLNGVNKDSFYKKYNQKISDVFNIKKLFEDSYLIDNGEYIFIPKDKLFVSNEVLINFLD